jgi:hypothetical protein
MKEDHWNLDTLYLLTRGDECVEPLQVLGETWGCEVIVYDLTKFSIHSASPFVGIGEGEVRMSLHSFWLRKG